MLHVLTLFKLKNGNNNKSDKNVLITEMALYTGSRKLCLHGTLMK